jgi:hypothetical protein
VFESAKDKQDIATSILVHNLMHPQLGPDSLSICLPTFIKAEDQHSASYYNSTRATMLSHVPQLPRFGTVVTTDDTTCFTRQRTANFNGP